MGVWVNNSDGVTPAVGEVGLLNSLILLVKWSSKALKKLCSRNKTITRHLYL